MWSIFYNVFRLEREFIENKLYYHILMCWCAVKKFRTNCKCWFCNYVKSHKWIQYCSKTYLLGKMYDRFLKIFLYICTDFLSIYFTQSTDIFSSTAPKKTPDKLVYLIVVPLYLKVYDTLSNIWLIFFTSFLVLILID